MRANLAQAGLTRTIQMRTGGARAWKNKCGSDEMRADTTSGRHVRVKRDGKTSAAAVDTTELAVRLSVAQMAQMSSAPWCRWVGTSEFGAAAAPAAAAWGIAKSLRWIWPNETMSCSASASRPNHAPTRRLPRTQTIVPRPSPAEANTTGWWEQASTPANLNEE